MLLSITLYNLKTTSEMLEVISQVGETADILNEISVGTHRMDNTSRIGGCLERFSREVED